MASIEDFKPYSEFLKSQRQQRSSHRFDFINVPSSPTGNMFLRNFKSHISSDETPVYGVIAYGRSYNSILDQIGYEISYNDEDVKPYYTLLTTSGIHHLDFFGNYSFVHWGERDAKFWLDKHDVQLLAGNANNTNAKKWKALFRDVNTSPNNSGSESSKFEAIGNSTTTSKYSSSSSVGYTSSSTATSSSSSQTTTQISQNHYKHSMSIDKQKIEYVIGIDLGHGETSAAYFPLQWDTPLNQLTNANDKDIDLGGGSNKVIPSVLAIKKDGKVLIGESAIDAELMQDGEVHVCFKKRPSDINGDKEQLMIKYMRAVYQKIRYQVGADLTNDNHVVVIACPSGWNANERAIYFSMAKEAGLPIVEIIKESRAAYIKQKDDPYSTVRKNMGKGVIVFDMGSSTLDISYLAPDADENSTIDNGYDCGASMVEQILFDQCENDGDGIKMLRSSYPNLIDKVRYEFRKCKEQYFIKEGQSSATVKIDLDEDFTGDEDLDCKIKFKVGAGQMEEILAKQGYIDEVRQHMLHYQRTFIPDKPIYGVLLTGGASRMDFLKKLIQECWDVTEDRISRDQDPSLTISRGVAIAARKDLRSEEANKDLQPLFAKISGNAVYDKFVEIFGTYLSNNIVTKIEEKCIGWRDWSSDINLNRLNYHISDGVKQAVKECAANINTGVQRAIDEETKELRQKVDTIVAAYNANGTNISLPSVKNLEVMNGGVGIDMNNVIHEISSSIQTESSNWGGIIAGAGVGAAVAMIFGGPLAWIIGGGALIGKWFFGEEETEEQKRQKAMSKSLSAQERTDIINKLSEKWEEIAESVHRTIFDSLRNNSKARHDVSSAVDNLMTAYRDALTKSRIMVD